MSERVVELTDEMLNAGAAALDHFDGPIPADHHERWGVVSLILVAALREAPYPASRPEAPAEGPERAATGETIERAAVAIAHTRQPEIAWDEFHPMTQEDYRAEASAVLAAIVGGGEGES
jgi:hypothetical protein